MSVFTVLCHGSGGHRSKPDKEIIACLGRRIQGTEYENYLILDGVGGQPQDKSGRNPLAGSFDWADRDKGAKRKDVSVEMGGSNTRAGGKVATASGDKRFRYGRESMPLGGAVTANAIGYGVEDNARHAIVAIADLPALPDTVNLIGWSRGSVTALVIANMLYDPTSSEGLFRSVKVNIFAIDPVAGDKAGTKDGAESRRLITPNVKQYLGLLNTGENRNTFSPQDLSRVIVADASSSNVVFLPFPGKHDSCAQNSNPKTTEVSDISWSLATRFLERYGTHISPKPIALDDRTMLARYFAVSAKAEEYAGVKQKGMYQRLIGKGLGARELKSDLASYTRSSEYFINEHHRRLFMRFLPKLYEWLFTRAQVAGGLASRKVAASSPIGQEIAGFGGLDPLVFDSLAALGVTREGAIIALPAPGSAMDAKLNAYRQTGDIASTGIIG